MAADQDDFPDQNDGPTLDLNVPELEMPPQDATALGGAGSDTLFGDDSMAQHMIKASALESFLVALTKDHRFTEFTRDILLSIMRVIKCEAGSIFELDQVTNELSFRAAAGRSSDKVGNFTVPMGQGIVGFVAESRQPLVVDDAQAHERHLKAIADALDFPCTSIVALPLVIRGKLYGVLELLNRTGEKTFSAQDVE
ncbi:MAG: GAF domain-containing protein, partial [Bdellovibrionota bacterium]